MNYGLLNFKSQNGKPGIFWSNEKAKKQDRKFGYKTKEQRFNLRQYPTDMRTDADNFLQPAEEPVEEKPKKPAKNFIRKNREQIGKKNKNKENDGTVTLTQEQLNAILASVGKVASGKEDALRISIDADKHEIKVESPGREGDGDHKSRRRYRNNKKDEEQSIFNLIDDNKKTSHSEGKSRRHERSRERSGSGDRYRHRDHSGDHHHRDHSSDYRHHSRDRHRDHSYERHHSRDRHRDNSQDRHRSRDRQRDYSGDRHYRHDSRGRRESRSRERYRTPSRERHRHRSGDRSRERRRHSPDDRSQERRRRSSRSPEDRHRRHSPSEGRYRKNTPERDERKIEKPKVEDNPPSPREIAGIPVSLPWKHMTKAERRRKEEEEKKRNFQELETKLHKNFKKEDYRSSDNQRRDDYPRRDDDRISDSERASSIKTGTLPPAPSSLGKLSLGELKRRQWEKERADSSTTGEFLPWGKPGAGAPIRTKSGNVAADYGKRKDLLYPFVNHRN